MKNNMQKQFVNSDFYTTVFLIVKGCKLIGIDKSTGRRFNFILEDKENRPKLLKDFFDYQTRVEPRKFISVIKELKSLMYTNTL